MTEVSVFEAADRAFTLMKRHGVSPTPHAFHVFYAYAQGGPWLLVQAIDQHVGDKKAFALEDIEQLYSSFIQSTESSAVIDGGALTSMIEDTMDQLQAAADRSKSYGAHLERAEKALSNNPTQAAFQKLVDRLVAETNEVRKENNALKQSFETAKTEAESLKQRLEDTTEAVRRDALTKLPNRKGFDEAISKAWQSAEIEGVGAFLTLIDIDHFKLFNDRHGHQVGDEVLRRVAKAMGATVRPDDVVARYGGEEFACVISGGDRQEAAVIAEALRVAVKGTPLKDTKPGEAIDPVTISLGLAEHRKGETIEEWIERADEALYLAKSKGRNRVQMDGEAVRGKKSLKNMTAMIVEDEIITSMLVAEYLKKMGVGNVVQAEDGLDAINLLRRNHVDLVICDAVMPRMDGLEFVVRVRTDAARPGMRAPILMMSAKSVAVWASAARDAGVNAFLTKPFSYQTFDAKVRQILFEPRSFIQTKSYSGPDRRMNQNPDYKGPERRKAR